MTADEIRAHVAKLESDNASLRRRLERIEAETKELPSSPAGFGNEPADKIHWTCRWVKANWSVRQEADEWKQRAFAAEAAIEACLRVRDSVSAG